MTRPPKRQAAPQRAPRSSSKAAPRAVPREHPALADWMKWARGSLSPARAAQLDEHVLGCARCARDRQLLQPFARAQQAGALVAPPSHARRGLRGLPAQRPAPAAPTRAHTVAWPARDVRGAGLAVAADAVMVARSCPGAEISVMATPPGGDARWHLEGRAWLHQPDARPINVVLAQADHVIATTQLNDGGRFVLDELVGKGWTLEFHLPDGSALVLEDPLE